MTLVSLDDTRRYISDSVEDSDLQPFLDAAEEWVKRTSGADWDASGSVTETFNFVEQGRIIVLKDEVPTSISLTGYMMQGSDGEAMTENSAWASLPSGKIQIIFDRYAAPTGLPGATVEIRPLTWFKIEVAYTASGSVPTPIREAVAMIAAAGYLDSIAASGDIISERLGDYSYSKESSGAKLPIPSKARLYLRPYNRRHRVRTT